MGFECCKGFVQSQVVDGSEQIEFASSRHGMLETKGLGKCLGRR